MKRYKVVLEFEMTSSEQDISDMYDGGVKPTTKQLYDMHHEYAIEIAYQLSRDIDYKVKCTKFKEVKK